MKPKQIDNLKERRLEKARFAKRVGHYLQTVRKRQGLSQEKLGFEAGYSPTYIGKIEQGRYSPSLHTIWRLSHALHLSLAEFLRNFE